MALAKLGNVSASMLSLCVRHGWPRQKDLCMLSNINIYIYIRIDR